MNLGFGQRLFAAATAVVNFTAAALSLTMAAAPLIILLAVAAVEFGATKDTSFTQKLATSMLMSNPGQSDSFLKSAIKSFDSCIDNVKAAITGKVPDQDIRLDTPRMGGSRG